MNGVCFIRYQTHKLDKINWWVWVGEMKKFLKLKKGIHSYIQQFVHRVKFGSLCRHEQFIISMIFTYLLTIAFSMIVVFSYFQDNMVDLQFEQGLWEYIKTTRDGFVFGCRYAICFYDNFNTIFIFKFKINPYLLCNVESNQ